MKDCRPFRSLDLSREGKRAAGDLGRMLGEIDRLVRADDDGKVTHGMIKHPCSPLGLGNDSWTGPRRSARRSARHVMTTVGDRARAKIGRLEGGIEVFRRVLAATVAMLTLAGCGGSATALPADPWGGVIGCLEAHPAFKTFDAYSTTGASPGDGTKAVAVWDDLKGAYLAYVGNNGRGADDLTGTAAASVSESDGPIRYGFAPAATPGDRQAVTRCVRNAYP